LLLGWLLHAPAPTFIAPSLIRKGERGSALSYLYLPGRPVVSQKRMSASARLMWKRPSKTEIAERPPLSNLEDDTGASTAVASNEPPAGSPYGSLSYGTLTGPEVRPALPVFSPDPVLAPEEMASVEGDVVIEVTIDAQGNIVQTIVLRSLGPAIDQKVLAAVGRWQFRPASRDGVAIPSKQDVYYHFPH